VRERACDARKPLVWKEAWQLRSRRMSRSVDACRLRLIAAAAFGHGTTAVMARNPTGKDNLGSALGLADKGDWQSALATLLDVWRASPHRELADLIGKLGISFPAKEGDWLTLARKHAPETLDGLLASILDKGSKQARDRIDALVAWPLDPRIDRWVASIFAKPPFTSTGARPFWTRLQPLTKRIVDATSIEIIAKARKSETARIYGFIGEYIDRAKLVAQAEQPQSRDTLEAIAARLGKKTAKPALSSRADALMVAVLENLEDDSARLVLADALIEANDPRGELITLQMGQTTPAAKKRAAEIIKTSRKALLGPLDPILTKAEFEKGFLTRAALRGGTAAALAHAIKATAGHPLWSTVRHLEGPGDAAISGHRIMRSLRSLWRSDLPLAKLAAMPLEAVGISNVRMPIDWLDEKSFASLHELDAYALDPELGRAVVGSPVARRVEKLTLRVEVDNDTVARAGELFGLAAKLPAQEVAIVLSRHGYEADWSTFFHLPRVATGNVARVGMTSVPANWEPILRNDMMLALAEIAKLSPASVTLERSPRVSAVRKAVESRIRLM
jgi:uncharacterized protein (TIGR02996 family)